jgi:hypothetical protein
MEALFDRLQPLLERRGCLIESGQSDINGGEDRAQIARGLAAQAWVGPLSTIVFGILAWTVHRTSHPQSLRSYAVIGASLSARTYLAPARSG